MKAPEEFCEDISKYYPEKDQFSSWYVLLCVLNAILTLSATFGNIIIICALTKTTSALSTSKILLLGLAVSDLGVGLVVQPLYISVITEILLKDSVSPNDSECNTKIAFLVLGAFLTSASFFIVSAISFDRFLAITLHLRYREIVTERKVTITIFVLWTLSAVAPVGYLFIGEMKREIVSIAFTITFFVTTTITFAKIYLAVRRHRSQISAQERITGENRKELVLRKRKFKSAMNIFYVYAVFAACFLPYTCTKFAIAITGHSLVLKGVFQFSMTVGLLNSSLNPIIFSWRMEEIRGNILETLIRSLPCLKVARVFQMNPQKELSTA
ncbi:adenosine receptor A3-like [Stylophora pistillata]|uniref:adenosine receptor A3-like n=1 Tax=Stylophora pistillata TaxID=50429 RepID=UPI000C044248|nr:adenosine receptor A3-like [Stylophora pistillata]